MERYVAFDIGDKRIGVAVSDPFNTYALPSQTYFRKGFKEDVAAIAAIAKEKGATVIVCGLPVNFDGSEALQTEKTRRFIDALKSETPIPVVCEDERFTTQMAHETLISEGPTLFPYTTLFRSNAYKRGYAQRKTQELR